MSHTADKQLLALSMACVDEAKGSAYKAKIRLSQLINVAADPDLLRAFAKPYYSNCLDSVIQAALRAHRQARKYGISKSKSRSGRAPEDYESTFPTDGEREEPVLRVGADLGLQEVVIGTGKPDDPFVVLGSADRWARKEREMRKSWLDKFLVNGTILRLCTAQEVREFMSHNERSNDFLSRCVNGMQDSQLVGDCVSDDDADTYALEAGLDRRH
jgi:hypothetical protein